MTIDDKVALVDVLNREIYGFKQALSKDELKSLKDRVWDSIDTLKNN